ncbi:class II peroxidase [Didymella exigua CBS 183.55]|uniref:Peroxidase n=1 Tax=Didymella exigua CBS 183.55 TaxID=1150837 RepID=A0A6A5R9U2_9PLEO|nr:class II peroxidase [Didymella exigua CBS 183.55]KAF1924512.1 class II peroxidase [Didymella exigua CBS 183.55]
MYTSALASSLLILVSTTSALSLLPRTDSCPKVWSTVLPELQIAFAGCGRDAHGAIRAPFHDCINNGCDGSLILTDECSRAESAGLSDICGKLLSWTQKYNTSAADMIEFAAAVAISSCPLGPRVRALVGRKDSREAAPLNSIPGSRDSISSILDKFKAKGFSGDDVVALMGTHSVAVQVNDDPAQAGKSLDSTPSIYDLKFYQETLDGTAPYTLQSDRGLANNTETQKKWKEFADGDTSAWITAFTDAWNRFAVIGNDVGSLQDCSGIIPSGASERRLAKRLGSSAAARAFVRRLYDS